MHPSGEPNGSNWGAFKAQPYIDAIDAGCLQSSLGTILAFFRTLNDMDLVDEKLGIFKTGNGRSLDNEKIASLFKTNGPFHQGMQSPGCK